MSIGFLCGVCGGTFVYMDKDKTGTYYRCNRCGVVIKQ